MYSGGVRIGVTVFVVCAFAACRREPKAASVAPVASGLVDAATARTCTVAYACGMSHPGLGTWSQSTSVDLAACTKTVASASGPFEAPPPPPGETSDASTASSKTTPLPASECERLANLVAAITADDARRESESAQIDTAACDLTVTCGGAAKISVQRQSRTGAGPVAKTIAALQ